MKVILFLICSICFFLSCKNSNKKNSLTNQKLFTEKIAQYEKNGKPIVLSSSKNYLIIYKDSTSFLLDNLNEPAKKILSAEMTMKNNSYFIEWDSSGKPNIVSKPYYTTKIDTNFWTGTKQENYYDYVYPYTSSDFNFIHNDSGIYFKCKYNTLDRGGDRETDTSHYLYYFSKPNELFSLSSDAVYDETNRIITDVAYSDPSSLAKKFFSVPEEEFPYLDSYWTSGIFKWKFDVGNQGNVKYKYDNIIYCNPSYNIEIVFSRDDFSSKEQALNILYAINDTIKKAQEKDLIEQINKEAIDIDDISNCFKNEVKAEKEFLNKEIIVKCSIDAIENADGWLDTKGYKYKIRSYSTELFGEWMSGYDIVGYTNDENFADLNCPNNIIMQCVLTSGSCRRFIFKDCKLILFGK